MIGYTNAAGSHTSMYLTAMPATVAFGVAAVLSGILAMTAALRRARCGSRVTDRDSIELGAAVIGGFPALQGALLLLQEGTLRMGLWDSYPTACFHLVPIGLWSVLPALTGCSIVAAKQLALLACASAVLGACAGTTLAFTRRCPGISSP